MITGKHSALFTVILLLLAALPAAPAEKIITSLQIDTRSPRIRLTVRSSASFTWRLERLRTPSPALGLLITPVEPDPQAPRDIPINSGLIKNIKIIQKEKEKSLLIAIEVVSFPHYSVLEGKNHREITLIVDKEVMEGSRTSSLKKKPSVKTPGTRDEKSLFRAFAIYFDAAGSPSLKASSPPLQVKREVKKTPEKSPQSFRKNLSLIVKASPLGKRPVKQESPAPGGASKSGHEILHREFVKTDMVIILKFLASHMGFDLLASPYVKGIKSIDISDMTAEEALPLVLRGTGYTYRISQKLLLVGPPDIIDAMAHQMPTGSGEGRAEVFVLKTIRIEMILLRLMKEFPDAHIEAHRNLNALTVTASPLVLEKIRLFLEKADSGGGTSPKSK